MYTETPAVELRVKVAEWMTERICKEPGWRMNATTLAEECADVFDLAADDADATIPEWVFEMSAEKTEFWQYKHDDYVSDYDFGE